MATLVSLRNPLLIPLYPKAGPISPNCIPAVQEQQLNHGSLILMDSDTEIIYYIKINADVSAAVSLPSSEQE